MQRRDFLKVTAVAPVLVVLPFTREPEATTRPSLILSGHYDEGKIKGRPTVHVCQEIEFDANRQRVIGNLDFKGPPVKFDQLKLFLVPEVTQSVQPFILKDGDKLEIIWYVPAARARPHRPCIWTPKIKGSATLTCTRCDISRQPQEVTFDICPKKF